SSTGVGRSSRRLWRQSQLAGNDPVSDGLVVRTSLRVRRIEQMQKSSAPLVVGHRSLLTDAAGSEGSKVAVKPGSKHFRRLIDRIVALELQAHLVPAGEGAGLVEPL